MGTSTIERRVRASPFEKVADLEGEKQEALVASLTFSSLSPSPPFSFLAYREKVVTHTAAEDWQYGTCRDISGPPVYQPYIPQVELHVKTVQDFSDATSYQVYVGWRESFFQRNIRDVHQDRSCRMTVPGLIPYVMVQQGQSMTVNPTSHLLASLCLFAFVYEVTVFQKIPHARYNLVKQLSIF